MVHILASPGHVRWGRAQPGPLLRANDLLPFEKGWQSSALFYSKDKASGIELLLANH
jgi:hypothetical protein